MTMRQILFLISWASFVLYAVLFAPDENEGYFHQLVTMDDPDAFLLMVFSFLGIYPLVFTALLLGEDNNHLPLWPFVLGMFFLGAFALMPYFFLSKVEDSRKPRVPVFMLNRLHSRVFHLLLFMGTITLLIYGVTQGDFEFYVEAFKESQFVHIMSIDFVVLTFLSTFVVYWKERRRGRYNQKHWLGMVPIFGALLYLLQKKE
ncbi:hypothetical protein LC065_07965 [Halobacillus litoralis]|uniref:hypothetical protein n=1 Tax=Halobacillus litoralis TaxID=45668 RepID=UPI001CFCF4FB|nr:hypothetical protein [Halobacillus litoralis]WLR49086.1 hypothetical protein LC065_07965 [Halobacillus litoralis]